MTDPTTLALAIRRVHRESAERGKALLALAKQQNDVAGDRPGAEAVTAMSAVVDMMHAVRDAGGDPADVLTLAAHHYENDTEGTW